MTSELDKFVWTARINSILSSVPTSYRRLKTTHPYMTLSDYIYCYSCCSPNDCIHPHCS